MKRTLEETRRDALRELVPHAHLMASSYAKGYPMLARELRRLGDRLDEIANHGSEEALSALFGDERLHT